MTGVRSRSPSRNSDQPVHEHVSTYVRSDQDPGFVQVPGLAVYEAPCGGETERGDHIPTHTHDLATAHVAV